MSATSLSDHSALSSGSTLWVLSDPKNSGFSRKIDFYLNFQMARAEHHRQPAPPKRLQEILTENQMEELLESKIPSPQHYIVATKRALPCSQIVFIPFKGSAEQWIQSVLSVWAKLGSPTLRIFVPPVAGKIDVQKYLPERAKALTTLVMGDLQIHA